MMRLVAIALAIAVTAAGFISRNGIVRDAEARGGSASTLAARLRFDLAKIQRDYVRPVGLRVLVVAGLRALCATVPGVHFANRDGRVELDYANLHGRFDLPDEGGAEVWTGLTVEVLHWLKENVPAFAARSEQALLTPLLDGALTPLDPASRYYEPRAVRSILQRQAGIGVEAAKLDGSLALVRVCAHSPAATGGLRPGDRIIAIDGQPLRGDRWARAIERLRGPAGSVVTVEVIPVAGGVPYSRRIVRRVLPGNATLKARFAAPGLAYLEFDRFDAKARKAVETVLQRLVVRHGGPLDGLVLDLRHNHGGLLSQAVAVADLFIEKGLLAKVDGRDSSRTVVFKATPGDALAGRPIVVLVDSATSSGAELVAAALQDHGRAVLVGAPTAGAGTVQTVFPLAADEALKLTTGYLSRADGDTLQASGVAPNLCTDAAGQPLAHGVYAGERMRDPAAGCPRRLFIPGVGKPDHDLELAIKLLRNPAFYHRLTEQPAGMMQVLQ